MKGNTNAQNPLYASGSFWLEKTLQLLKVQEYGKGSIRNYMQQLTLLFKHYNAMQVEDLRQQHIERYLIFIKENHKVGRTKCRSVAQACSFFFKKVMPVGYIVPSNLYPKKQFKLPNIMTEMEVVATYINIACEGVYLVHAADLHNRGSPKKIQKAAL